MAATENNKRLISKALDGELTPVERDRFSKVIETEEGKEYHNRIQHIEAGLDQLLFKDSDLKIANVATLKKMGLPRGYVNLIVRELKTNQTSSSSNFHRLSMLTLAIIIALCIPLSVWWPNIVPWWKHIAIVLGIIVLVLCIAFFYEG